MSYSRVQSLGATLKFSATTTPSKPSSAPSVAEQNLALINLLQAPAVARLPSSPKGVDKCTPGAPPLVPGEGQCVNGVFVPAAAVADPSAAAAAAASAGSAAGAAQRAANVRNAEAAKRAAAAATAAGQASGEAQRKANERSEAERKAASGSGSSNMGMWIMLGLVGMGVYFMWASPKIKRKGA